MILPKQFQDRLYLLLQQPTIEKFREFIENQTGEQNDIDYKKQWIEGGQLAKEMLSIANYGGGIIVFGVEETEDHTISPVGLGAIKDKSDVSKDIERYIPSNLEYEIYDFCYDASEYVALQGKKFQILVISNLPQNMPFMAKKESGSLKTNEIYIRRGTSCMVANQEEIKSIIEKKINYIHPLNGEPLSLYEHLEQLKILYKSIQKEYTKYDYAMLGALKKIADVIEQSTITKSQNPFYPEEEFDEFVARMIAEKKKKIERVLDLY